VLGCPAIQARFAGTTDLTGALTGGWIFCRSDHVAARRTQTATAVRTVAVQSPGSRACHSFTATQAWGIIFFRWVRFFTGRCFVAKARVCCGAGYGGCQFNFDVQLVCRVFVRAARREGGGRGHCESGTGLPAHLNGSRLARQVRGNGPAAGDAFAFSAGNFDVRSRLSVDSTDEPRAQQAECNKHVSKLALVSWSLTRSPSART
jgi:hypothetical protein